MTETDTQNLGWNEPVFRVSEINETVRELLRETFPLVQIEGEVSGLTRHRSGHWYFSLKDESSSLRCVMFAFNARRVRHAIEDGTLVRIRAELSLYQQRGEFQAVAKFIEPVGEGALRQAFEELRAKLLALGWFDDSLKKVLPRFPRSIVVISSPEGDATRDVFTNVRRRYPIVSIVLEPTAVQGQRSAPEICNAIANANALRPKPDLAILTRGGGSLEDLYVFNSESVAQAIFKSEIPIVSAIGHEADYTIADFCSDLRAPTPSTAAELVTPDAVDLAATFENFERIMRHHVTTQIGNRRTVLQGMAVRIKDPRRELSNWRTRVTETRSRLALSIKNVLQDQNSQVRYLQQRLNGQSPIGRVRELDSSVRMRSQQLQRTIHSKLEKLQSDVANMGRSLHAVSPLAVLDRGFAVVSKPDETEFGQVIRSASSVEVGEEIEAHLADGILNAQVTTIVNKTRS